MPNKLDYNFILEQINETRYKLLSNNFKQEI